MSPMRDDGARRGPESTPAAGHRGAPSEPGAARRRAAGAGARTVRASRVTVFPGPAVVPPPAGRPTDLVLMADLRAWRSAHARADLVPAYVIASDALLAAIVEERPGSIASLRRVNGIGQKKLDRYGAEILEILARH